MSAPAAFLKVLAEKLRDAGVPYSPRIALFARVTAGHEEPGSPK